MVGNGVWLHNIGRVVKQKLHNNLTPSLILICLDGAPFSMYSISEKKGHENIWGFYFYTGA
jgi:hypothetical protein